MILNDRSNSKTQCLVVSLMNYSDFIWQHCGEPSGHTNLLKYSVCFLYVKRVVLIFCLVDWEFLALRNFKRSEILKMLVMFKSILMIYRCCDIHLCWNFAVMFLDIAFIWTFFWSIHCWMKSFSNQYIVICPVNYELMLIKLTTW